MAELLEIGAGATSPPSLSAFDTLRIEVMRFNTRLDRHDIFRLLVDAEIKVPSVSAPPGLLAPTFHQYGSRAAADRYQHNRFGHARSGAALTQMNGLNDVPVIISSFFSDLKSVEATYFRTVIH
jgi:hypothetical protein